MSKGHPPSTSLLTVKPDQGGQRNPDLLTVKVSAEGGSRFQPVQSMPNLAAAAAGSGSNRRSHSPEERNHELTSSRGNGAGVGTAGSGPPRGVSYPPMSPKQLKRQGKAVTNSSDVRQISDQSGKRADFANEGRSSKKPKKLLENSNHLAKNNCSELITRFFSIVALRALI